MKEKNELKKIRFNRFYYIVFFLVFAIIVYRISILTLSTVVEGTNLQSFANQRVTRKDILESKRGSIYDVNGNVLAQNVSSYTLVAYLSDSRTKDPSKPQHVVDYEYTASELATVVDLTEEQILYYLSKKESNPNLYQVYFGNKTRNLTELKKSEIEALNLPGIDFVETQERYYPYGDFLSYTIGYATKKTITSEIEASEEKLVGEMGIESYFDNDLTGNNGYTLYQKDRNGYKIANTTEVTVDAVDGKDIYLTIDSNVQFFVEQAVAKMLTKSSADWIGIMLADAKTGAILASYSYPSFNPNTKNIKSYLDLNTSIAFEPGSTMKIFSFMAAIENGVYDGNEQYKSGVFIAKDKTEIGDWDRKGWGMITFDQGFALSSNVAIMNIISKHMNGEMLKDYYKKLGFGSKVGIELPNEATGKIDFKYETEILNAGFGQGITTTILQNIQALTSISNNGILLKPYIVDKIVDSDTNETIYQGKKKELGKVASTETVTKIKKLMGDVINGTSSTSTGYYYYMEGYDFIGKTGTAQVANTNGKGYSSNIIRALAGMYPGDDPEVLIYIAIKDPSSGTTPIKEMVQEIIKNTSKYLKIYDETATEKKELEKIKLDSYLNKKVNDIKEQLNSKDIKVVVIGDGDTIVEQYPIKNTIITSLDKVYLKTNYENIKMPNIIGYSQKDFNILISFLNIPYEQEGIGYITNQSILPGTEIKDEDRLYVTFSSAY